MLQLIRHVGYLSSKLTLRLFEAYPEMQGNFKTLRNVALEDLKMSQELRQHSSRVMGFVNKLISRLGSEDQVALLTGELCQRHLDYGALPQHMMIVGGQFISVLRSTLGQDGPWDEQTQVAWEKLFQMIAFTYERMFAECWSRSRRGTSQRHSSVGRANSINGASTTTSQCCTHVIEY